MSDSDRQLLHVMEWTILALRHVVWGSIGAWALWGALFHESHPWLPNIGFAAAMLNLGLFGYCCWVARSHDPFQWRDHL